MKIDFQTMLSLFLCLIFSTSLFAQETAENIDFQDGLVAYQARNYDQALDNFKDSIGEVLRPWKEYEMLGFCYYHLGKLKEAAAAFQKSLKINPNNPVLSDYLVHPETAPLEPYFGSDQVAQSVSSAVGTGGFRKTTDLSLAAHADSLSDFDLKIPQDAFDFHFYTGYDYSFMGDFMNGLQAWANSKNQTAGVSAIDTFNQNGAVAGLKIKKAFGPHEISLDLGVVTGQSGQVVATDSYFDVGKVILDPTLWSATLNYTYHFESSGNFRPYVSAGGGFYAADVRFINNYQSNGFYSASSSLVTYAQGDFTSSVLGGTVGTGFEVMLGKSLTLDLSGTFRVATFGQLLSNNLAGTTASAGQYPYTLMIYQGSLYYTPQSTLTGNLLNGARYAVLDYSGLDLTIGLHFYFGGEPVPHSKAKPAPAPSPSSNSNNSNDSSDNSWEHDSPIPESYKPAWDNRP